MVDFRVEQFSHRKNASYL